MSEQDRKIQGYILFLEELYVKLRGILSYYVLNCHTAKPSPALPSNHFFILSSLKFSSPKVPIILETVTLS